MQGQEPQAGDRHWSVRGASRGGEGAFGETALEARFEE